MARKKKVKDEVSKEVEALDLVMPDVDNVPQPYWSLVFQNNEYGEVHEIQSDWKEFKKLPELIHKWLKKNGVDNKLILK